ncbi:hypothetical protein DFH08DRAFT_811627 [Mycena albidolilacea]|uniref:Uncharacterized protein n=1 Tax=Mycena albidolilacea TaxID=1033008 RepID=A0AAD6ZVP1_9AGAR|nr:hypothetical protein DFH08DRAFT_811627 [Mycena albidolilacea]
MIRDVLTDHNGWRDPSNGWLPSSSVSRLFPTFAPASLPPTFDRLWSWPHLEAQVVIPPSSTLSTLSTQGLVLKAPGAQELKSSFLQAPLKLHPPQAERLDSQQVATTAPASPQLVQLRFDLLPTSPTQLTTPPSIGNTPAPTLVHNSRVLSVSPWMGSAVFQVSVLPPSSTCGGCYDSYSVICELDSLQLPGLGVYSQSNLEQHVVSGLSRHSWDQGKDPDAGYWTYHQLSKLEYILALELPLSAQTGVLSLFWPEHATASS